MIFNKVLEAELEQCLDRDFVLREEGVKDGCKGTQQVNLRLLSGRLIGREWLAVSHEYKRGRSVLGSSTAPAPPPRLPCSTLLIPRRSSDDFCICATTSLGERILE
jgi:hypothetical protein